MPVEIRTLIVDDEPLAREGIRLLLREDPDYVLVGECGDGETALESINRLRPDLLFLDIHMPGSSGFELLAKVSEDHIPLVVFVSAFDRYAIKAFDIHALDYLLKPVNAARFRIACERVKRLIVERRTHELTDRIVEMLRSVRESADIAGPISSHLQRFAVKDGDRVYFVPVEDVDWIGAANYYVELHCGKKIHLMRETLNAIELQINPQTFLRIHRSTIVNISRIRELRRLFSGDYAVVLNDGTQLRSGRSYREHLDRLLHGSTGR